VGVRDPAIIPVPACSATPPARASFRPCSGSARPGPSRGMVWPDGRGPRARWSGERRPAPPSGDLSCCAWS